MSKLPESAALLKRIRKRFNKACKEYSLLQDNDKILIGVSGGKDSLMLLKLLTEQSKIYKPRIQVMAAHIKMSNIAYKTDTVFLQEYCRQTNIQFIETETSFDASTDKRKSPCFLCSWNRRKELFSIAQANGCNKIALGHNLDDFLETMLMNITFQGAFSAMSPIMKMKKFPISVIRPLCMIDEKDIAMYAELENFPKQIKNCPHENASNRHHMKRILSELEQLNPEARYNLWGAMSNIQHELLPPPITKQTKTE